MGTSKQLRCQFQASIEATHFQKYDWQNLIFINQYLCFLPKASKILIQGSSRCTKSFIDLKEPNK